MIHSVVLFIADSMASYFSGLQEFERHTETVFSILSRLLLFGLVLIALSFIIRVLADKSYSIRRINVPGSFEQVGHSGPVVANRIYYRIQQIIQRVSAAEFSNRYSTSAAETDVSVDLVGIGMPVKGFIEMLGSALGIQRSRKIDADIFIEKKALVMLLRITGHNPERLEAPLDDALDIPLKTLIFEAAETILKYSNDEVLQTYFGLIEQIGEKQIRLARYRLEKYKNRPDTEVNAVAALAWGLCMLKRYDEAEEKIKGAIPSFKKPGRIYVIWGTLLQQLGRHDQAIEKLLLAIRHTARNESNYRKANILVTLGRCYSQLGKRDLAIEYFQKAIQTDDNSSGAYFNLSKEHIRSMHHREKVYELLEKALARGLRPQAVMNDPEYEAMLRETSVKKLVERYGES